jgi:hypothetical protein
MSAVLLVEVLALSFRLNLWRWRADALEHAALTYADTPDERAQEKLVISAGLNLLGLVLYLWALLALFFMALSFIPDMAQIQDSIYLLFTSGIFIAYAWLRTTWLEQRKQPPNSVNPPKVRYTRIARWLHWMALEIDLVRSASFELEKTIFLKKAARDSRITDQPVYVIGLARSGTTVTLGILEKAGPFHSPTYRNMPFVLCPNFWQGLTKHSRLDAKLAARAHGDGIAIGFDSPESFEEVFWRTACETQDGPALAYAAISQDDLADFAAYRQLSLRAALQDSTGLPQNLRALHTPQVSPTPQSLRYLSKNNNNVMRFQLLSNQAGAHVVLIIRDPLATAWSLYRQHQLFVQIQVEVSFARAYMRWLGHHEFGQGHKPLAIGSALLQGLDPTHPDYWLAYWLGTYQDLWQTWKTLPPEQGNRILWLSHERMCQAPALELKRLFGFVNIDEPTAPFISMLRPVETLDLTDHFEHSLAQRARNLHRDILASTKP